MRRLLLLATLGLAFGCGGPAYVIEDSELPVFLGDGDLLTARRGSQEVNVRHVREDTARLQQSWLDPLSPEERRFFFDPTWGRVLSVGRRVEGENPLRSGSPHQRDRVQAELFAPDTVFSLRSWPGGDELVSRKTHPGLAQTPDGNLVLRRSREAQFELYDTAGGVVVSRGPLLGEESRFPSLAAEGRLPGLSAACFTGPDRFAYAWEGQVYLGRLEGRRCVVERLSRGDSLALHRGRLYVLVRKRWLRAFEIGSRRPLWQAEIGEQERVGSDAELDRFWRLQLSPDGETIAVQADRAFLLLETAQGRPVATCRPPPGSWLEDLSLGNQRWAALYLSDSSTGLHSITKAMEYGPAQGKALEIRGDVGAHHRAISLSADGQWLAISVGTAVQVWRLE